MAPRKPTITVILISIATMWVVGRTVAKWRDGLRRLVEWGVVDAKVTLS